MRGKPQKEYTDGRKEIVHKSNKQQWKKLAIEVGKKFIPRERIR